MALGGGVTGIGSLWWANAGTHDVAVRPSTAVHQDPSRSGAGRPAALPYRARHAAAPAAPARAGPFPEEAPVGPEQQPAPRAASERPAASGAESAAHAAGAGTGATRARSLEATALRLVNAVRADGGCRPLEMSASLHVAADRHSADMARSGYFSHISPEGESPWERAERAGYADPASENIARGFDSAAGVVEAWMDSPDHRRNILDCDSRAIGIGVHTGGDSGPYWTQVFGYE